MQALINIRINHLNHIKKYNKKKICLVFAHVTLQVTHLPGKLGL